MTLSPPLWPPDLRPRETAEPQLRAQKEMFENLVAVARAAVESPTIYEALQNILTTTGNIVGAERGSIFMLDPHGTVTHSVLMREQISQTIKRSLVKNVMHHGLAGWVSTHKEPALIHDTLFDTRWLHLENSPYTVRSALAVPLFAGNEVLQGVVMLFHSHPHHFTLDHQRFLQATTDHMSLAVRNAQYYDAHIKMLNRQVLLYSVLTSVSVETQEVEVAQAAIDTISGLSSWNDLAILLAGDAPGDWKVCASSGKLQQIQGSLQAGTHIVWRALSMGSSQRLDNVSPLTKLSPFYPGMRSEMAVPLRRRGELLGCMYIGSEEEQAFELEDLQLAESLVEALILALDNARHITRERLLSEQLDGARAQLEVLQAFARNVSG
ncbi:MAG TPA: GAF domain-containing protein, partial [Anaerolineales bacterium]|nr:GAF domain-containing protein [Anaerolineales bacterium]